MSRGGAPWPRARAKIAPVVEADVKAGHFVPSRAQERHQNRSDVPAIACNQDLQRLHPQILDKEPDWGRITPCSIGSPAVLL